MLDMSRAVEATVEARVGAVGVVGAVGALGAVVAASI